MKSNLLKFQSICSKEWPHINMNEPHILPIYNSSAFVFENIEQGIDIFKGNQEGYVYSRYGNPTLATVSEKLAALESIDLDSKAYALLTGSGMGAITTALLSNLQSGDIIVTQADLYGGTTELLKSMLSKFGIKTILCDLNNEALLTDTLASNKVKLIYCESPSNPVIACVDLKLIADQAKKHNVLTIIDNTFASPYLQRPLNFGFDVVIYSTTKYLNGMGNALGGAIITKNKSQFNDLWNTLKLTGAFCSPNDAWLLYNGLKTFPLRMDVHCNNALSLATFLEKHDKVKTVNYPGLSSHKSHAIAKSQMSQYGGMLSFEIDGAINEAMYFMNNIKIATLAPTLGNVDTLILHPATSSHLKVEKSVREKVGITDGLIRVSVGTESIEDIIEDFGNVLDSL